ncbi:MAG: MBL fold metallo-hydrolase [Tannerella sp.]|jgi:phosphoribosyl 1,2-cyclic phosphodiesterase|nr:MBL fold metallo-hydrolase [Tannerella sp.]
MKLTTLGSGSSGNSYILENDSEALIIEAGVPFASVQRALNFNISKIVGCLVSHEHKDHSGHVHEFPRFIPVFASLGTMEKCGAASNFRAVKAGHMFTAGSFRIIPFAVKHDAAEPFGFFIHHPESGSILFATDTYYLPNPFLGLNNIMIEANYRMDILEKNVQKGIISDARRNRTLQSHMSYETCLQTLLANDLSGVNHIVLIHLSNDNSNAQEFQAGIREATGKTVHVADKGMSINFNKTPF